MELSKRDAALRGCEDGILLKIKEHICTSLNLKTLFTGKMLSCCFRPTADTEAYKGETLQMKRILKGFLPFITHQ